MKKLLLVLALISAFSVQAQKKKKKTPPVSSIYTWSNTGYSIDSVGTGFTWLSTKDSTWTEDHLDTINCKLLIIVEGENLVVKRNVQLIDTYTITRHKNWGHGYFINELDNTTFYSQKNHKYYLNGKGVEVYEYRRQ